MPGLILAAVSPDNTPHGYNWTFAFPMLLFIVIALILYALFSRPHRRVPSRPISATSAGSRAPDARPREPPRWLADLAWRQAAAAPSRPREPAGARRRGQRAGGHRGDDHEPGSVHT